MYDYGLNKAVIGLFFIGIFRYHIPFCNNLAVLWRLLKADDALSTVFRIGHTDQSDMRYQPAGRK